MSDADGYVRGETLDVFFDMLDESTLEDLFDKEMDNIIIKVNNTSNILLHIFTTYLAKMCSENNL